MAQRTIDVVLGDYTFKLTSLLGEDALSVYHQLLKHAFPPLVAVFEASGMMGGGQVDFTKLAGAARELMGNLSEDDLKRLRVGLLKNAAVQLPEGKLARLDQKPVFDAVFTENVHWIFELMWEAIKLNYSRFFADVQARVAARMPSLSTSQTTPSSSGPASDS